MCHRFDTEMLTIDTSVPEFEFRFHFTGWSVKQSLLLAWTIPTWHWWLGDSLEGFHSSQQFRFHDSFFFKGTTTVAAYTHNTITIHYFVLRRNLETNMNMYSMSKLSWMRQDSESTLFCLRMLLLGGWCHDVVSMQSVHLFVVCSN